jgi:IS5 family transposase
MRRFVGIDLGREPVPDETTICRFRHLLEQHKLAQALFDRVNAHLAGRGLQVAGGTIVDATIIAAPSSTKNAAKARDPEMHQTRKGQQWYFGMQGPAMVFRDEAAHWRGQQDQADPLGQDHRRQRA